ncbi:hypothetical protein DFH06DRAFT_1132273 [Mycena polygramma]|nr:hypothetical protein DFH06DRAFT_1132273 [Mycena polygramma]
MQNHVSHEFRCPDILAAALPILINGELTCALKQALAPEEIPSRKTDNLRFLASTLKHVHFRNSYCGVGLVGAMRWHSTVLPTSRLRLLIRTSEPQPTQHAQHPPTSLLLPPSPRTTRDMSAPARTITFVVVWPPDPQLPCPTTKPARPFDAQQRRRLFPADSAPTSHAASSALTTTTVSHFGRSRSIQLTVDTQARPSFFGSTVGRLTRPLFYLNSRHLRFVRILIQFVGWPLLVACTSLPYDFSTGIQQLSLSSLREGYADPLAPGLPFKPDSNAAASVDRLAIPQASAGFTDELNLVHPGLERPGYLQIAPNYDPLRYQAFELVQSPCPRITVLRRRSIESSSATSWT